jgi:hypothetical protein
MSDEPGSLGEGCEAPPPYPVALLLRKCAEATRSMSPFLQPASAFEFKRPVLVGEFWTEVDRGVPLTAQRWAGLKDAGYAGGMGWAMLAVAEGGVEGGGGDVAAVAAAQLTAPRRLVAHETRDAFLGLLRQMREG